MSSLWVRDKVRNKYVEMRKIIQPGNPADMLTTYVAADLQDVNEDRHGIHGWTSATIS